MDWVKEGNVLDEGGLCQSVESLNRTKAWARIFSLPVCELEHQPSRSGLNLHPWLSWVWTSELTL